VSTPKPSGLATAQVILEILRIVPRRRFISAREIADQLAAAGMARDLRSPRSRDEGRGPESGGRCRSGERPGGWRPRGGIPRPPGNGRPKAPISSNRLPRLSIHPRIDGFRSSTHPTNLL